jgi:2-keto-4-pentenoate hydratase
VLAGSFVSPITVSKGDKIEVDYNQFGKIMCSF